MTDELLTAVKPHLLLFEDKPAMNAFACKGDITTSVPECQDLMKINMCYERYKLGRAYTRIPGAFHAVLAVIQFSTC
jgi:hypothetical protein